MRNTEDKPRHRAVCSPETFWGQYGPCDVYVLVSDRNAKNDVIIVYYGDYTARIDLRSNAAHISQCDAWPDDDVREAFLFVAKEGYKGSEGFSLRKREGGFESSMVFLKGIVVCTLLSSGKEESASELLAVCSSRSAAERLKRQYKKRFPERYDRYTITPFAVDRLLSGEEM